MYKTTDKIIGYLNKQYIKQFSRLKSLVSFDEVNVLQSVTEIYDKLGRITKSAYLVLAKITYEKQIGEQPLGISDMWVVDFLNRYDPVTKYVFTNEADRKRMRLVEALIASTAKAKEIDAAMRAWSLMCAQYAVEVTDEANLQALKDKGVRIVRWRTEDDEKRCNECVRRDGKVYDIDNVPPKQHLHCRCWIEEAS